MYKKDFEGFSSSPEHQQPRTPFCHGPFPDSWSTTKSPEVAKKLPKYPIIPATLLGRLAVSVAFRGRGHGATLLMDALYRTLQHSREVASAGVIVDAKDAAALPFYTKYGFLELPRIERRLFLPMGTVEQLFR